VTRTNVTSRSRPHTPGPFWLSTVKTTSTLENVSVRTLQQEQPGNHCPAMSKKWPQMVKKSGLSEMEISITGPESTGRTQWVMAGIMSSPMWRTSLRQKALASGLLTREMDQSIRDRVLSSNGRMEVSKTAIWKVVTTRPLVFGRELIPRLRWSLWTLSMVSRTMFGELTRTIHSNTELPSAPNNQEVKVGSRLTIEATLMSPETTMVSMSLLLTIPTKSGTEKVSNPEAISEPHGQRSMVH